MSRRDHARWGPGYGNRISQPITPWDIPSNTYRPLPVLDDDGEAERRRREEGLVDPSVFESWQPREQTVRDHKNNTSPTVTPPPKKRKQEEGTRAETEREALTGEELQAGTSCPHNPSQNVSDNVT